jgi:cell division protein FtsL
MRSVVGTGLLVVTVIACALAVVTLRDQWRQLSVELHALQTERDALDVEWGKLLLEEATWSRHRRVESVAREQLDMSLPDPRQTVMIDLRAQATR